MCFRFKRLYVVSPTQWLGSGPEGYRYFTTTLRVSLKILPAIIITYEAAEEGGLGTFIAVDLN